jgi:hypothetical protein
MPKNPEMMDCGPKAGLIRKLDPSRLRVSGKFHAILGCMLGQRWTTPRITALCITSDGFVLAEEAGDVGFNHLIGDEADLRRNIRGVCRAVAASQAETTYLLGLVDEHRA